MSKRYGRNQKRRHRETIAALERSLSIAEQIADTHRRRGAELERRLRSAVEIKAAVEPDHLSKAFIFRADFDAPADRQSVAQRVDLEQLAVRDFMGSREARARMVQTLAERMVEQLPGGRNPENGGTR